MKIEIYSTKGKKRSEIEATVNTWGELKSVLSSNSIETSGMKAIIGETQLTLESTNAILPDYDFTLFLTPIKVKSGKEIKDFTRTDCYAFIKQEKENKTDNGFFKTYSKISTIELRKLISKYIKLNTKPDSTIENSNVDVEKIDSCISLLNEVKESLLTKKVEINSEIDLEIEKIERLEKMYKEIESNL